MKQFTILAVLMLVLSSMCIAQTTKAKEYKPNVEVLANGNYTLISTKDTTATRTGKLATDPKTSIVYPVFANKKGREFIYKLKKDSTTYRFYITRRS